MVNENILKRRKKIFEICGSYNVFILNSYHCHSLFESFSNEKRRRNCDSRRPVQNIILFVIWYITQTDNIFQNIQCKNQLPWKYVEWLYPIQHYKKLRSSTFRDLIFHISTNEFPLLNALFETPIVVINIKGIEVGNLKFMKMWKEWWKIALYLWKSMKKFNLNMVLEKTVSVWILSRKI